MATVRSQEAICSIVKKRTIKLKARREDVDYTGVALLNEDTLLVTDIEARNLQIYNRQDGERISASDRLEGSPWGVCVLSDSEVAVCLEDGKIVIMSLESIHGVKQVKTINVSRTGFYFVCESVAKWTPDKLLVSGRNVTGVMLCWCVVSVKDKSLVSTHDICKAWGGLTNLAVKGDTVYVSCPTSDSITSGVYAFDVFNPHKPKFLYQHQELNPGSIMADRDYVYVCDEGSKTIHQVNDLGQLVVIHTVSSDIYGIFYDDQRGVLYTTSWRSKGITVYKMDYPHQAGIPVEIMNMDDRSIQVFEDALKDGKETIYSIRILIVGHLNVGKSTLTRRLLGEEVDISERCSTEGINVHVNCCDVSLSTGEWKRREKGSEQDDKLQRLVKLLNENYQKRGSATAQKQDNADYDKSIEIIYQRSQQKTDQNLIDVVPDYDKSIEIIYQRSQQKPDQKLLDLPEQQNVAQTHSSAASHQEEPPSTDYHAIESHKDNPLREMLKLLKESRFKVKQDANTYARLTMWDFAGQYAFYTTHQMFLTKRAIYLMVADISEHFNAIVKDECYFDANGKKNCKVLELMEIWMNSIHSCASSDTENLNSASSPTSSYKVIPPPVILVGTHVDQIKQPNQHERGQKYLKKIRSYLRGTPAVIHLVDENFAIDNSIVDSRLEDLKRKILDVASQQPYWGEQIPTRWYLLEQHLMRLKDAGVKVISRSTVEGLNKEETVQINESEEMDLFLKYLHETGLIIYFSIEILRDDIILDPQWLIYALKTLINAHPSLPESSAENGSQPSNLTDYGSQLHIPTYSNADINSHSSISTDSAIKQKWSDFKEKGILSPELVAAIWTQDKHPDLHAHKDHLMRIMEQFNIIAKPRSFDENGEKLENYYLVPCMLRQECPTEVTSLVRNSRMVSTTDLCCVFKEKYLPPPIFHRLIAACITRWSIAKKKVTSENLIFCGGCVFDIDLFHRLTLHFRSHVIYARVTRLIIDDVKTLDARLCARVRKFIDDNLSKITSYLGQNLTYDLQTQYPSSQCEPEDRKHNLPPLYDMWFAEEGPDSDVQITHEHMNHARLCIALATVCGKAMREVLRTQVDSQYTDVYQAILANRAVLTTQQGRRKPLLNNDQIHLVFPNPQGQDIGQLEKFDLSLLYILIRNISSVQAPSTGWGNEPQDHPQRDTSLGASVERIRSYRNEISGHSAYALISSQDFQDYWNELEAVLHDIDTLIGGQAFSSELETQRRHVFSVYEDW